MSRESKRAIIRALSLSGDVEHLLLIAKNEKEPTLRLEAVRAFGLVPASKSGTALLTLYRRDKPGATPRGDRSIVHPEQRTDEALKELIGKNQPRKTREQAAFWLASARGHAGFETLKSIVPRSGFH